MEEKKGNFLSAQKAAQVRFEHVSAIVAFSPTANPLSRFDLPNDPWFHIVGLDTLAKRINLLVSPLIDYSEKELQALVSQGLTCLPKSRFAVPQTGSAPQSFNNSVQQSPAPPKTEYAPLNAEHHNSFRLKIEPRYEARAHRNVPASARELLDDNVLDVDGTIQQFEAEVKRAINSNLLRAGEEISIDQVQIADRLNYDHVIAAFSNLEGQGLLYKKASGLPRWIVRPK